MIKINLAPLEEVENKTWFLPDVIIVTSAMVICLMVSYLFFAAQDAKINALEVEKLDFIASYNKLKPDLARYDELKKKLNILTGKIDALKKITVSKIARYKPIIIFELTQTLKPKGLWFSQMSLDSKNEILRMSGSAFDNFSIAEFISSLESTKFQTIDATDMRTQVYFSKTYLRTVTAGFSPQAKAADQTQDQQAFAATQDKELFKSIDNTVPADAMPTLNYWPRWEINVRFAERAISENKIESEL